MKLFRSKRVFLVSQGGLGNQLFTWNAAHIALQPKVKRVYIIHLGDKQKPDNRQFQLQSLLNNCPHSISILQSRVFNWIFRCIDSELSQKFSIKKFLKLSDLRPDRCIPFDQLRNYRIFRGYFQDSESVKQGIELWIQELQIAIEDKKSQYEMSPESFKNYSAFHIRRGDYVENSSTIGVLSLEYYERFKSENIPLYISSDDASVRTMFPNTITLSLDSHQESRDPWPDFVALSDSSLLAIANSTFSWWAGILVLRKGGRVIAPSPWNKVMTLGDDYLRWEGFEYADSLFE